MKKVSRFENYNCRTSKSNQQMEAQNDATFKNIRFVCFLNIIYKYDSYKMKSFQPEKERISLFLQFFFFSHFQNLFDLS